MTYRSSRRPWLVAVSSVFALAVLSMAPSTALARARQRAVCSLRQDGATSIAETTARFGSGGKRYTVTLTSSVVAGGDSIVTVAARVGKRDVLRSTFSLTVAGTRIATDFGAGFKGMSHIELATTDGTSYVGQLDGAPLTVTTAGGAVGSVTLPDGTPAPTIKVKRAVKRALTKAGRALNGASCNELSPAPVSRAIFDSCNTCKLGCQFDPTESGALLCLVNTFATGVACAASVAVSPVFCIASFELNGLSCTTNYTNCEKKCLTSDDCCHVFCPGAVGQCCNGDGEVCCGKDKPGGGSCCTNCCGSPAESASAVCCGRRTPSSEDRLCINPAIGLCCEAAGTICGGDECCEPGATCCDNSYCAPAGGACCSTSTSPQKFFSCNPGFQCADPQANLCCPAGVAACNGVCCTGNQICAPGNNTCCDPADLCGDTCCPSHNCLNGNECCPTPNQCGGHCAGFGECCNGVLCPGVCVPPGGPTCCSADRVCPPSQCCPLNTMCQSGSCVPCGCPADQECCPGGTEACCASPEICCQPEGRAKGCYTVNDCLGLR